jgi:thioredoxin 1
LGGVGAIAALYGHYRFFLLAGLDLNPYDANHQLTPKLWSLEMSSDAIVHVSDASFAQDVLAADVPVLVDFWAAWCGPCKMIAPILDDLAEQYAGKLKIAKVDVDANKEIPGKFGIRGIPTLILFKNGEPAATKVGALSKAQLVEFINSSI